MSTMKTVFQNCGRSLIRSQRPTVVIILRWFANKETVSCSAEPPPSYRPPKVVRYAKVPGAYYGGRHMITMLPGSGIGPEMMNHVIKVFEVIKAPIDFETIYIRPNHYKDDLDYAVKSIRRNTVCLKAGNIEDVNIPMNVASANVEIRRQLDMFVMVVHCMSVPHVRCRHDYVNVVIIRQNTEGEYAMLEHENKRGVVESMKIVTRCNCMRLAKWMYKYCADKSRRRVTVVHKASAMKVTDGLFLQTVMEMAPEHSFLEVESCDLNEFCMELVINPQKYDVVVTSNLYGAFITNTVCGLIGGAGLMSGRNYGKNHTLFETATRNSAETLTGRDTANPLAVLNAAADLLWHLKHEQAAYTLRRAILRSIKENMTTRDLGGTHKSSEVVDNIIAYIKEEGIICPFRRI